MSTMFYNSQFSHDLTPWDTSKTEFIENIFDNCPAPVPYWANYEKLEQRARAIEEYQRVLKEKEELQHSLALVNATYIRQKI